MDGTPEFWVQDNGEAYTPRTKKKAKRKIEFVGWGSRELIEFLQSIGKDTTKALSHYDVTNIVNQYVIDSKLIHPVKKKRVVCDEWLQVLFGGKKQSVFRNKIHDLLEPHLVENHVDSEGDPYSSGEDEDTSAVSKRPKISISDKKTLPMKKAKKVSKSSLAAISPENIKLVYLKRSLVQELLNDPDKFESKVVGSFVKIKSDPYDIYQKNSHQLQLVTGVKKVSSAGDDRPPLLRLASTIDDISISVLSDDNFSEEECEDLRRRVKDGVLKQPTVGELGQKVVMLHEDITKHWLARELVLLKIRLDQANEKGWRYKVTEYLDRRNLLQTPEEQSRLLNEIPEVMPEKVEPEINPDDPPDSENENQNPDESPKAADWDWEPFCNSTAIEVSTKVSSKQRNQEPVQVGIGSPREESPLEIEQVRMESNRNFKPSEPVQVDIGSPRGGSTSETEQVTTESNRNFKPSKPNGRSFNRIEAPEKECNGHAKSMHPIQKDVPAPDIEAIRAVSLGHLLLSSKETNTFPKDLNPKEVEIITLSDDEDELEVPSSMAPLLPDPECPAWHYLDPMGRIQGAFSLTSLKRWSDCGYFQPDFRVWTKGHGPGEAVLLTDILGHVFPS